MTFNTISMIGLGYIGLPTAAAFASRKIKVISEKINQHQHHNQRANSP
ncbi:UDP-N-acetyl-D-mannosaminuronic acid dehydrogenase [Halopseudomonas salegens]|uniref:UDP-N-acetyl-D-mannosaminuronic acid dehydrogenase n=1 Tax=Halopseudomonas salegens TaxID=1434072 RepID=A0A1H2FMH5_9GAMM|nr:UDP-N-acetyl-D-mannosaminuronic acid dehydrogenase [Halopseudomonas salegens]